MNQILKLELLKTNVDPPILTDTVQNGIILGKGRKNFDSHLSINGLVIVNLAVMNFQNNSEFTMWLFCKCTFIRSSTMYCSNFGNKNEL